MSKILSVKEGQEIPGIGYWEQDYVSDKLLWSNQVYQIFGVETAAFEPTVEKFFEIVHPDDRDKVDNAFQTSLENRTPYEVQHRIVLPDGSIKHVVEKCQIVTNKAGEPLRSIGSIQDVTQAVESELKLEASQKKFMAISKQATEGITVADMDGNYVFVNPAFCKMSGYSEAELLNMTVFDMKGKDQDHATFKESKEKLEGQAMRVTLRKKDGTEYPTEIIGDVIHVEGESLVLGTIRDISGRVKSEAIINKLNKELEHKVRERTAQLNETIQDLSEEVEQRKIVETQLKDTIAVKEVLFKEITHRVKNNMQIISSLINLQKPHLDSASTELLEQISHRIHAMALIHETLYKTNDFKELQFDYYLASLIKYVRESYDSGHVNIQLEADKGMLPLEIGTSLGMIVIELVINAIKHAFVDLGRIGNVKISFNKLENDAYTLSIADDGNGMDKSVDIHKTNSLGLQLVTGLVDQISGEIEHRVSEGTLFEIRFKS